MLMLNYTKRKIIFRTHQIPTYWFLENAKFKQLLLFSIVLTTAPVSASHTFTGEFEPANSVPSGLNFAVDGEGEWLEILSSSVPVIVHHTIIVESADADSNFLPSQLKLTDGTNSL
jgi:hypothetical protein